MFIPGRAKFSSPLVSFELAFWMCGLLIRRWFGALCFFAFALMIGRVQLLAFDS